MKDQLTTDAAGNLQTQIDTLAGTGWTTETVKGNADAIVTTNTNVTNLDASVTSSLADIVNDYTTTLNTTWSGSSAPFTKAQTITGILATDTPIIDVVMSGVFATDELISSSWGLVYRAVATTDTITFYATEKPTVSLPLQFKVVR